MLLIYRHLSPYAKAGLGQTTLVLRGGQYQGNQTLQKDKLKGFSSKEPTLRHWGAQGEDASSRSPPKTPSTHIKPDIEAHT